MNLQPLGDRVIIQPMEAESKTKGGIVLPDTVKEKPQEGKVVAVGKGRFLENGTIQKLQVEKGDIVLYGKYAGTEISTKEGQKYLIVREEDILAVVEKEI